MLLRRSAGGSSEFAPDHRALAKPQPIKPTKSLRGGRRKEAAIKTSTSPGRRCS